ncbi:MAG: enoyl-CoA hydratase/isomerase family protein [Nocardia sp.]|nr:enoyl-CoA hydratase/isomerase family protein [Nocardia sp.]
MAEFVTVDRVEAGIAVLRFARPPLNLIDLQLALELSEAAASVAGDDRARAVVVYGDERIFSAGDELTELARWTPEQARRIAPDLRSALGCLSRIPQPTVAAITGYAVGAGLELALGADHRLIGDNVKLGFPQIRAGLIPLAGIDRLNRLVGAGAAKDLVYTGRFVAAEEAARLGLVDEVVAPDDVFAAAVRWARRFTNGPSRALAAAKSIFEQGPDRAESAWAELFATEDRGIGTRACADAGPAAAEFVGR